jgi:hypothetical protein
MKCKVAAMSHVRTNTVIPVPIVYDIGLSVDYNFVALSYLSSNCAEIN